MDEHSELRNVWQYKADAVARSQLHAANQRGRTPLDHHPEHAVVVGTPGDAACLRDIIKRVFSINKKDLIIELITS